VAGKGGGNEGVGPDLAFAEAMAAFHGEQKN
jgi:hypothetical protein